MDHPAEHREGLLARCDQAAGDETGEIAPSEHRELVAAEARAEAVCADDIAQALRVTARRSSSPAA